jgi:anti-sigma factor RsiW
MNCTEARQHWMLYLDSQGDPELHLRVRDHIGECPACAKWFAEQQRLEQGIGKCLSAGPSTPELWTRVLSKAGIQPPAVRRRRWPVVVACAAAAAAVLLAVVIGLQIAGRSHSTDLTRNAADLHEQWLRGEVSPDFVSSSDHEVDRYLKTSVPFRVHCPPRTDVNFQVQGAGVRTIGQHQAAYIVGKVGQAKVSILVLEKAAWGTGKKGPQHCREGEYQVVSGIVADNLVVVISTAPADTLEKLLSAYGTYHES